MQERQKHQLEVQVFLQEHFSNQAWEMTLPRGRGNETYFARTNEHAFFIKLGVQVEKYRLAASVGLTPPVIQAGSIEDGTSIMVQPYVEGKKPDRRDYRNHIIQFASAISQLHHLAALKNILPKTASDLYSDAGLLKLSLLQQKWDRYKTKVPALTQFIDESLDELRKQVIQFQGAGLVASHNDICNGNWIIAETGQLYLIDLESMSLDDPALDMGATLWWYYPPELRKSFLREAGYGDDLFFQKRMNVRMAMHCLNIVLPREDSFDQFCPDTFPESLNDFRAILAGEENPEGYD